MANNKSITKTKNITPPPRSSGFTIIEVALVLAIAGLIFLVVFIAWPALQNSQADNARRQDVNRVVTAIEQYKVDNQGNVPGGAIYPSDGSTSSGFSGYVGKLSRVKTVKVSSWYHAVEGNGGNSTTQIKVNLGYPCWTTANPDPSSNNSAAAVSIPLASGGEYCAQASI